ncbi:YhbY family RNA-binding protein [Candidatus Pacearchaeota archaeon]|nr:YhbY family RNA-binding protein [Candidatus Pacearchaeota archaeon]
MAIVMHMQIGKNGFTNGSMELIKNALKTHTQIRIAVHKTFTRDKEKVKAIGNKISEGLGKKVKHRIKIIGFTIILNKR